MGGLGVGPQVRFVGREAELDALRAVVAAAASGPATIALVEGEAGIGKSRLMIESLDFAREQGFLVLVGACDEFERGRPLSAVGAALLGANGAADVVRPEFARVFRGAMRPDAAVAVSGRFDEGWLVVETVLDVLEDLAARGPWSSPWRICSGRIR